MQYSRTGSAIAARTRVGSCSSLNDGGSPEGTHLAGGTVPGYGGAMTVSKLRRQLAWHAARLIWTRQETDWFQARSRAIRELVRGWVPPKDLPQRSDIREQLLRMETQFAQPSGAVSDVSSPAEARSNATDATLLGRSEDRWSYFASLLYPLENVRLPRRIHPEGDALYHSLQVFELARAEMPYDEDFLLAALLHAVGEALDRKEPVEAGLAALESRISKRTAWLIAHLDEAQGCLDTTIGSRARRRLEQHESFQELLTLARCDRRGRQRGVVVPTVQEALDYLRELAGACEGDEDSESRSWW